MISVEEDNNFKKKFYINDVGFVVIEDTLDTINIIDVYVNDEYRNKGYASKILEFIFDYYKDMNVRYMLEVKVDNLYAIKLYEKFNFKVIHIRRGYYNGVDALIMERK